MLCIVVWCSCVVFVVSCGVCLCCVCCFLCCVALIWRCACWVCLLCLLCFLWCVAFVLLRDGVVSVVIVGLGLLYLVSCR